MSNMPEKVTVVNDCKPLTVTGHTTGTNYIDL